MREAKHRAIDRAFDWNFSNFLFSNWSWFCKDFFLRLRFVGRYKFLWLSPTKSETLFYLIVVVIVAIWVVYVVAVAICSIISIWPISETSNKNNHKLLKTQRNQQISNRFCLNKIMLFNKINNISQKKTSNEIYVFDLISACFFLFCFVFLILCASNAELCGNFKTIL